MLLDRIRDVCLVGFEILLEDLDFSNLCEISRKSSPGFGTLDWNRLNPRAGVVD